VELKKLSSSYNAKAELKYTSIVPVLSSTRSRKIQVPELLVRLNPNYLVFEFKYRGSHDT